MGANELPLAQAAEFYASQGIPIFPLAPRSKHPLKHSRGFYDATAELEQVRRWWSEHPEANIGVALGEPSGRWLLDADAAHGGLETLAALLNGHADLDGAAWANSGGGGKHAYFLWTRELTWLRCGALPGGIDVKATGGYAVLPPSVHPSGRRYEWASAEDLERFLNPRPAAAWLLAWIFNKRKVREMPPADGRAGRKIPKGRRNVELTSIAGVLRARGASESELRDLLARINETLCDPPLRTDEVARIAHSVARYAPREEHERPDAQRIFERLDEGHYRLLLPGIASELEIDMLRRDSGSLVGELAARCYLPDNRGTDGLLTIGEFNVSSVRARVERAKLIASRANTKAGDVDWPGIIEDFCARILAAEREGEPAIDLGDVDPPRTDAMILIDGFPILKQHPVVLFGDGGACKSLLALYFAWRLTQQGETVLYADWELDAPEHRERLEKIAGDARGVKYARCLLPLREEAERLRRMARELGATYLTLDSVALGCDGPPEAAETAMRYFQALRRLGLGCLLIAHVTKGEEGEKKPFGSVFWHNSARATWFAKRTEQVGDEKVVHVALFNRKANLGALRPPLGFEIRFEPDRTVIRRTDAADIGEFAEKMTLAQRMAHVLRRGALTVPELAEQLEVEPNAIRAEMSRRKGIFTRLSDNRVALAARDGGTDGTY